MRRSVAVRNAGRFLTELVRGGPRLVRRADVCEALRLRRSADEQKLWSDIRVDGTADEAVKSDTNKRRGRFQSYSYSHSSVRCADGSVSGQTMREYVDHAGRKKHSRERRVGDTRMLETTDERPGTDRPMHSRELYNVDSAEAFDGVWAQQCR